MSGRYSKPVALVGSDGDGQVLFMAYTCTHCGCVVVDLATHDRVNGLDLVDTAEQAMKGTTPLAPPEPPAS